MKIEEIKTLSNLYNELYNILDNRYDFIENINFDCGEDAVEVTYAQRVWGEYDHVSYQIPFEYLVDEDSVRKFIDMEEEKKRIIIQEEEKRKEQEILESQRRLYEKLKAKFEN